MANPEEYPGKSNDGGKVAEVIFSFEQFETKLAELARHDPKNASVMGLEAINFANLRPTERDGARSTSNQAAWRTRSKYKEAYTNNDAAALAACYTWDAVIVTPQGPVYGRDAIENWYADQFEQWHPKNQIDKVDPDSLRLIGTAGDAVWMNGEWNRTIQGGPSGDSI